jgi:hypothetical protein
MAGNGMNRRGDMDWEREGNTTLHGMGEITVYAKRCEATILKLVRTEGFPARKVGGIWVSDKVLIDAFWREQVEQRQG